MAKVKIFIKLFVEKEMIDYLKGVVRAEVDNLSDMRKDEDSKEWAVEISNVFAQFYNQIKEI